jgi:1,4-dihydroxy-6-naphthoate synthase
MPSQPDSGGIFTLGHSPDPDDAFMFYALAEHKIDTRGYRFEHILQDIETLNQRATRGELHISAISIHAYAYVLDKYALLPCGASMGDGYGPLLVAKAGEGPGEKATDNEVRRWLRTQVIAVPGPLTSAVLALRLFMTDFESVNVPFDQIFGLVQSGGAGAGLIIHEGQLTYANEGFTKILDLGEWWKKQTRLPLPLGGNVIRKDIPPPVRKELSDILRESIHYGLEHREAGVRHSMAWARNLDTALADRFIGMYVNDLTMDYGETGRQAIQRFLGEASEAGIIPAPVELEFVE